MTQSQASALWASNNPILTNGDIGIESDTGRAKIGNGIYTWLDLPYFVSGLGVISDILHAQTTDLQALTHEILAASGLPIVHGNILYAPLSTDSTDHSTDAFTNTDTNISYSGGYAVFTGGAYNNSSSSHIAYADTGNGLDLTNFTDIFNIQFSSLPTSGHTQ